MTDSSLGQFLYRKVFGGRRLRRMLSTPPGAVHFASRELASSDSVTRSVTIQGPSSTSSYDVVHASHVLEHIKDDRLALSEVRRVLRPWGIAILPIPLVSPETVEYPEPNLVDDAHWRAPGPDYFDRYREFFSSVRIHVVRVRRQVPTLPLRRPTKFPTVQLPLRGPMTGERHGDMVPVCYCG